jgi:P27 family predicted phage terminase small subunit
MPAHRKSRAAKALTANDRPDRRTRAPESGRLNVVPEPPATLSAGAAAEWRELAPAAVWLGTLAGTDLRAFALLCETLATEAAARATLAVEGMTVATAGDGRKAHACVRVMETARVQATRLLAEFGLTPRGRAGVDTAPMGIPARATPPAGPGKAKPPADAEATPGAG